MQFLILIALTYFSNLLAYVFALNFQNEPIELTRIRGLNISVAD